MQVLSPLERGPGLAGGASWAGNPAANLRRPSARSAEGDPGPLAGNQRRPSSARFGAEEGPDPSLLAGAAGWPAAAAATTQTTPRGARHSYAQRQEH